MDKYMYIIVLCFYTLLIYTCDAYILQSFKLVAIDQQSSNGRSFGCDFGCHPPHHLAWDKKEMDNWGWTALWIREWLRRDCGMVETISNSLWIAQPIDLWEAEGYQAITQRIWRIQIFASKTNWGFEHCPQRWSYSLGWSWAWTWVHGQKKEKAGKAIYKTQKPWTWPGWPWKVEMFDTIKEHRRSHHLIQCRGNHDLPHLHDCYRMWCLVEW